MLFGGLPAPLRAQLPAGAAAQPGDLLYPIVCEEVLYVLGRMRVQQIIPVGKDRALLQEYFAQYGASRFLVLTCTTEVVLGVGETGILLDRPLPGEILQRLTYMPRRGPRPGASCGCCSDTTCSGSAPAR